MTSKNDIKFCSCGNKGMGGTTIINGIEYIQCAHCLLPVRGSEKPIKQRTSK